MSLFGNKSNEAKFRVIEVKENLYVQRLQGRRWIIASFTDNEEGETMPSKFGSIEEAMKVMEDLYAPKVVKEFSLKINSLDDQNVDPDTGVAD